MSGKRIRVFVASPSDVRRERDSLFGVINELNRTCDSLLGQAAVRLELVRWETDTFPGIGRPQGIINEQIGDYDIFIGILWSRLGTPTGEAESGTIEEFEKAYAKRKKSKTKRPYICFYFNRAAISPPRSVAAAEQLVGVVKFREELAPKGLFFDYDGASVFADTVRPHLAQIVGHVFLGVNGSSAETAERDTGWAHKETLYQAVKLTAIGPQDACYGQRSKYEGHVGVVIEAEERDGWLGGTFRFDEPLFEGDNGVYTFFQFQVEP